MRNKVICISGRSIKILWSTTLLLSYASAAHAATPTIVTGFLNLVNDATTWLLGLIPGTASVMIGYHALMKQTAEGDQAEVSGHNRAMINILKAGAVGTGAVGLVKTILSYFA
jgi:hypothetical protein